MIKDDMIKKINEIDNLLDDTTKINDYINYIKDQKIDLPDILNDKILNTLEIKSNYKRKETKILQFSPKDKVFNILKVVACTVFALVLWELVLSKPVSYANTTKVPKKLETHGNISNFIDSFNNFLMKPSEIKGGEK